jgi:hypothetical protein
LEEKQFEEGMYMSSPWNLQEGVGPRNREGDRERETERESERESQRERARERERERVGTKWNFHN